MIPVQCDITSRSELLRLVNTVRDSSGHVDVLINNAELASGAYHSSLYHSVHCPNQAFADLPLLLIEILSELQAFSLQRTSQPIPHTLIIKHPHRLYQKLLRLHELPMPQHDNLTATPPPTLAI